MHEIFIDPKLQDDYDRCGYAKFKFLSSEEASELVENYKKLKPSLTFSEDGVHITQEMEEREMKEKVFQVISSSFKHGLEKTFKDYECYLSTFIIKNSGAVSDASVIFAHLLSDQCILSGP